MKKKRNRTVSRKEPPSSSRRVVARLQQQNGREKKVNLPHHSSLETKREREREAFDPQWRLLALNCVEPGLHCFSRFVKCLVCVCVFFPQWDGHWKRTTRMLSMWKTSISNIRRAFGGLLPGTRNPIWLFFGFTRLWLSSQLNCYRFLLCFTWWLMMVSFMVWVAPLKRQKKKETKTFRPKTLMFDSDRGIRCARFAAFENDQTQWEPWYSILTSCGRPFFFDFLDWVRCSSFKNSPTTHRALIFDSNQLLWSTFCSDLISNNLVFLSIFVCSDSVSLWVVGFWVVFFLLCVVVVGHVFISRIGSSFYSRRKKIFLGFEALLFNSNGLRADFFFLIRFRCFLWFLKSCFSAFLFRFSWSFLDFRLFLGFFSVNGLWNGRQSDPNWFRLNPNWFRHCSSPQLSFVCWVFFYLKFCCVRWLVLFSNSDRNWWWRRRKFLDCLSRGLDVRPQVSLLNQDSWTWWLTRCF